MKPNRTSGYFMKRSHSDNSRQSYRQRGNQFEQQQWKRYCPDPSSNYQNTVMPYGPHISNNYVCNNGVRWTIPAPVQVPPQSFGHQVAFPFPHLNSSNEFAQRHSMPIVINSDSVMNNSPHSICNANINRRSYNGAHINSSQMDLGLSSNGLQMNNGHHVIGGNVCKSVIPTQLEYQQSQSHIANPLISQNTKRKWNKEDALRALKVEEELCKRNTTAPYLVIRFPDPPLDCDMVKGFSKQIEAVHFQKNSSPRFCFVRLAENANAEKVIEEVSKIAFGMGYLRAELRFDPSKPPPTTKPEQVDPYTLYIGNLSLSVTVDNIKRHFPGAQRYDLAFKSKIKPIRYAFIRYENIEKSIAAFKHGINIQIDGRSLVLRFRRAKFNYPSENSSLERNEPNNESRGPPLQNVFGEENNTKNVYSYESVVKEEDLEDYIKEENYDSEYSYGDDCNSPIDEYSHSNSQTGIKSERCDNDEPLDSHCTSRTHFTSKGDQDLGNRHEDNVCSQNIGSKLTGSPQCVKSKIRVEIMEDKSKVAKKPSTSTTVSITEKKYIEQLYDQLNSSNMLKKEVLSDFDELDELLKEVN